MIFDCENLKYFFRQNLNYIYTSLLTKIVNDIKMKEIFLLAWNFLGKTCELNRETHRRRPWNGNK